MCGEYDPRRDGVSHYTCRLASSLRDEGFDVVVAAGSDAPSPEAHHVETRWRLRDVPSVARALRRLDLDVVHVQFAPSAFAYRAGAGLLADALRPLPVVTTLHEYGWWRSPPKLPVRLAGLLERRGWWDRETLRLAVASRALVATNPVHGGALAARLPTHAPLHVVPIGANVAPDDGVDRRASRSLLPVGDGPLVVFFGFVHPVKGIRTLLEAAARLAGRRPGLTVGLVGGVESLALRGAEARAWRREVAALAEAAAPAGVVVTGWVGDAEVSTWLAAADVVALPFTSGLTTKSGSLLAALAHGAPVVGTTAEPPDPELQDGDVARLVPPRDPAALADALAAVLDDDEEAERRRTAGRRLLDRRSWPAIAAAHAELYGHVLDGAIAR